MDFVTFDEIVKKTKRFGRSIGLYVLVHEYASELEEVLTNSGLSKFSSLPDHYGNLHVNFRHQDYADYFNVIRNAESSETDGDKFPLRDVDISLVFPNRDQQKDNPTTTVMSGLERVIEEKAAKPSLDLGDGIGLLIYQIPLKFSLIRKSARFRGTKTYPIRKFVDDVKDRFKMAINSVLVHSGSNPEYNFGRNLIANMQSANIPFYAFGYWNRQHILLCENNPSNGGLIAYQKDVPFIYRGLA